MNNKIGDTIRYYRHKRGLTLEQLAKAAHISRQTLSRYETGIIGNIPSDRIEKLATALKVSPAAIMGWEDDAPLSEQQGYYNDPEVAEMANALKDDPQLRILLDAKKNLSKDEMESIINIAKMMLKKDGREIDE